MTLLGEAAALAVGAGFSDVDRAELVFQVGVVRYSESSISEAIVLFDQALVLAESSDPSAHRLRSDIYHWRARCHRRNRDWVRRRRTTSSVRWSSPRPAPNGAGSPTRCSSRRRSSPRRQGRWLLARTHAERARELFEELGDSATVARLLNNLAGLESPARQCSARAIALLEEAFEMFVELDLAVDAGYVCSSLAEIRLDSGERGHERGGTGRKALALLGRPVSTTCRRSGRHSSRLGRALLRRKARLDDAEPWLASADETFEQASLDEPSQLRVDGAG